MKTARGLAKLVLALGKLIARITVEGVKDVLAFFRRRQREIEWPDAGTASTIW